ncbi:MAG TPA: hypothetical protein VHQ95_11000 [Pyrinomonadaceae bacterium]|nr:hypothetical protein [Pyrinomonadaceae bacterium]
MKRIPRQSAAVTALKVERCSFGIAGLDIMAGLGATPNDNMVAGISGFVRPNDPNTAPWRPYRQPLPTNL